MRLAAAALAVLLSASVALAESRTYEIRSDPKNLVEFHAADTYDEFDGRTSKVTGTIVADPAKPSAARVDVTINLDSLDTGIALRNREMRQRYLETPKWPNGTFKSIDVEGPAAIAINQPADLRITGDLTIHNVTKRVTLPVRVVLIPDGRVHITTQFNVHMPDFGISVPSNILVTVDNNIPVRLDVWAVGK